MQVWCSSGYCAKCRIYLTGHETNDIALHELLRIETWQLNLGNVIGYPITTPKGLSHDAVTALAHSFTLHEEGELSAVQKFNFYFNVVAEGVLGNPVDCVVHNGRDLLLLNTRTYKGGNVIYRTSDGIFHVLDSRGTTSVRQYHMSDAIRIQEAKWARKYPEYNVQSMVVVMPTINGQGRVSSEAKWQGGIEITELGALIEMLSETQEQTNNGVPRGLIYPQ